MLKHNLRAAPIRCQEPVDGLLGGGGFQLGFRLTEMAHVGDYPELESVSF